jgi:glutathione S-transferase
VREVRTRLCGLVLRVWKDAVESRPSIRDTMSEREHYLPVCKRYADDTAMSELAKASRAGRGVPSP